MKKILITGAAGYIGSALTPFLASRGFKVIAVDRFFFGDFKKKIKNVKVVKADIRNLNSKIFQNVYGVIDLAAISNDLTGEKFKKETHEINFISRFNNAKKAKKYGVKKYILPSSCSNYGKIPNKDVADEGYRLKPLTNYSKANANAEKKILKLANDNFCVTILRQGTVYGYSPRMRFDLVINRMTHDAWNNGLINLLRDGTQRRPTLHIKDAIRAMYFMLITDENKINKEIFNVGGDNNNLMIKDIVKKIKKIFKKQIKVQFYGSKDHRSYFVSFNKINSIGFKTKYNPDDGIKEILKNLKKGKIKLEPNTITLEWYQKLEYWNKIIKNTSLKGKIF